MKVGHAKERVVYLGVKQIQSIYCEEGELSDIDSGECQLQCQLIYKDGSVYGVFL